MLGGFSPWPVLRHPGGSRITLDARIRTTLKVRCPLDFCGPHTIRASGIVQRQRMLLPRWNSTTLEITLLRVWDRMRSLARVHTEFLQQSSAHVGDRRGRVYIFERTSGSCKKQEDEGARPLSALAAIRLTVLLSARVASPVYRRPPYSGCAWCSVRSLACGFAARYVGPQNA